MTLETQYDFRTRLVESLKNDIIGPQSDDEVLDDLPLQVYIAGILYPNSSDAIDDASDIDTPDDDLEVQFDAPVTYANRRYPSSMGLTFALDPTNATIKIEVSAAKYEQTVGESQPDNGFEAEEADSTDRAATTGSGAGRRTLRWRRLPVGPIDITLDTTSGRGEQRQSILPGLELYSIVRPVDRFGAVPVTVVLVNTKTVSRGLRDEYCFFQARMVLSGHGPDDAPFVERQGATPPGNDEEIHAFRLLYRHAVSFARGHGCSAEWQAPCPGTRRTSLIWTSFAPTYNLPIADSNLSVQSQALVIRFLGSGSKSEVIPSLRSFIEGYQEWITENSDRTSELQEDFKAAAERHVEAARTSLNRMVSGIDCLESDLDVWRAFQLANRAMLEQRARSDWLRYNKETDSPVTDDSHLWRPFQLAFMLLSLESIANPQSMSRATVDLLWFPTGGGKTEAYLALIAFTVFLRRIRHAPQGDGLTAIMRYTLRLLTIQQFERATLLICCCEDLRRKEIGLGESPISIGLWVGQGATPNTLSDAEKALRQSKTGHEPAERNPMQLKRCPWCGTALDHSNYSVEKSPSTLVNSLQGLVVHFPGWLARLCCG